jgi:hypothetical protein
MIIKEQYDDDDDVVQQEVTVRRGCYQEGMNGMMMNNDNIIEQASAYSRFS